jgi:hypothetical protein
MRDVIASSNPVLFPQGLWDGFLAAGSDFANENIQWQHDKKKKTKPINGLQQSTM